MLELARGQTPKSVRDEYVTTFREMRRAGYTAVGEFHTSGSRRPGPPSTRPRRRASRSSSLSAYAQGGLERFRQASVVNYFEQVESLRARGAAVGVAPHSVRACPPDWLEEIGRYAERSSSCTSMRASSRARSRSVWPSTVCVRSSSWRAGCPARGRRSCTPRTRRTPSSTSSRRPAPASASARRPRPTSVTVSHRSSRCSTVPSRFASARTRTCASIRSRNYESSRASRAASSFAAT